MNFKKTILGIIESEDFRPRKAFRNLSPIGQIFFLLIFFDNSFIEFQLTYHKIHPF